VVLRWAQLTNTRGYVRPGPPIVLTLDYRLGRRERRCVLAHELEHVEQDSFYEPDAPKPLIDKLEDRITRAAVDKLIPPDELDWLAARAADDGEPLMAFDVQEWFDVDLPTVHIAMNLREIRKGRRLTRL
jgi:hypothetical protein